jgi:carboxyl-terminal processing protease
VASDITLPSLWEELEIGEKNYDYALPWEKIDSAKYTSLNLVSPNLQKISKASSDRVARSEEYAKLTKSIAEYKQNSKLRTQVSLKEDKAKEGEKKDLEADELDDSTMNLSNQKPDLYKDISLHEGIMIAADYAKASKNEELVDLKVEDFEAAKKKALLAEKTSKTKTADSNIRHTK